MIINSVYGLGDEIALSQFEATGNQKIILLRLWRRENGNLTELIDVPAYREADRTFVNAPPKMEGQGQVEALMGAIDVKSIKVADPVRSLVALAAYMVLKGEKRFEVSKECSGWKRIEKLLKQDRTSVEALAFLQGIVAAKHEADQPKLKVQFTTEKFSRTVAERMGYREPRGLYPF